MNCKSPFLVVILLFPTVCLPLVYFSLENSYTPHSEEFFFGVTFGGKTTAEAKTLIDKVKGYTNLFVVDNWDVGMNETLLTDICDVAVAAGLHIIVYFDFLLFPSNSSRPGVYNSTWNVYGVKPFHIEWLSSTVERWGDKFLGVYLADEPGGNQIDAGYWSGNTTSFSGGPQTAFANVTDYSDAADRYIRSVYRSTGLRWLINSSYAGSVPNATGRKVPVCTADNALYWFDYLAGYDTVFAEFGWNHNEVQHMALCRGAANVQNKQWGVIITWASNDPPYLASGVQMLQQMNMAYYSGAEYLLVFNYPQLNPYGAFTDEHFSAMETFWNQIKRFPRNGLEKVEGEVALVLPKDYAWGMRQADDKIWGLWPADDLSPIIGKKIATLISKYDSKLDIIYDDPQFNYTEKYSTIYYWNSSTPLYTSSTPIMTPSSELYVILLVVNVAIIYVPFYVITKRKNRSKPDAFFTGSESKAKIVDSGRGKLELVGNIMRFYTEKGSLRKQKKIAREIPLTDIESIKNVGSEVSIKSKGVTETFIVENTGLVDKINERLTKALEEQRILQEKEAAKQERKEIGKILEIALETTDLLFDTLRSLHGKVDWNRAEIYSKIAEEKWKKLSELKDWALCLNFEKLLSAVKAHNPKEISNETFTVLKTLYGNFRGLTSKNRFLKDIHPNLHDVKTIISAYYTLNDVMLGAIVGDEENGKEIDDLVRMLCDLSKRADLRININELKGAINKLGARRENENAIKESRMVFRKQLKAIITDFGIMKFNLPFPKS